jgi:hypothetical protein
MAYSNSLNISDASFEAGADLRGKSFLAVQLNSAGKVVMPTGQGVRCLGILQMDGNTGETVSVRLLGFSRALSNGAVAMAATGVAVTTSGTSGKLEANASGDYPLGIAVEALPADGAGYTTVLLIPAVLPAA